MSSPDIVVYGATGLVGRRVAHLLDAAGAAFAIAGRSASSLAELGAALPSAERRIASLDAAQLAKAFAGVRVVVNCAGPIAEVGEPVLVAALAAGAHHLDLGGDQTYVHAMYERHESTARRAGLVSLPGAALSCAIGDWAAAWAGAQVAGAREDAGDVVRDTPAPRIAEDDPFDDIAISYVYDDLVMSPASQRSLFGRLDARGLAWRRDRWEAAPGGARRSINAGADLGGERQVVSYPAADVISVPRHLAARAVQTYLSTTRSKAATRVLGLVARALPFVPRAATELLAPYQPEEHEYERTRFAVVAQVRRGFSSAQVTVSGHDPYVTSAVIASWIARHLAARRAGPTGMRAPSELFHPEQALREVSLAAGLAVEPSF
jgi:hypothetical protein